MFKNCFKKFIALGLGLVLSLSAFGFTPSQAAIKTALSFSDTTGHWSVQVVEEATAMTLLSGYPNGTFKPDKYMTRLEAISVIIRAMGLEEETDKISLENNEIELPKGMTWGQKYLIMAVQQGLLAKTYVSALKYDEPITRAEVATLIAVSLGLKGEAADLTFSDSKSIVTDYQAYVAGVIKAGIMTGIGNNEFGPNQGMKRGQMAALLAKLAEENWYNNTISRVRKATITEFDELSGLVQLKNEDNTTTTVVLDDNLAIFTSSGKLGKVTDLEAGEFVHLAPYNGSLIEYVAIDESSRDLESILDNLEKEENTLVPSEPTTPATENSDNNQSNTNENNNSNNENTSNNQQDTETVDKTDYYTSTDRAILKGTLLEVESEKNRIKLETTSDKVYWITVSSACDFYDETGGSASKLTDLEKNWQLEILVSNTIVTELAVVGK